VGSGDQLGDRGTAALISTLAKALSSRGARLTVAAGMLT
jgi:hypothetical protein